jgi:hypothetical protein
MSTAPLRKFTMDNPTSYLTKELLLFQLASQSIALRAMLSSSTPVLAKPESD